MKLNEKLSKIQVGLKAKKSRYNSFGKYNYRSAEDILEASKPFLKEHSLSLRIEESLSTVNDMCILTSQAILTDGEDEIIANAVVGVDMDQRGMNLPQKFGSASSYAKKYALGNLFLIDDTADSDATNTHGKQVTKASITDKNDEKFKKAVDYIKKGGTLEAIKSKYNFSKELEAELKKL